MGAPAGLARCLAGLQRLDEHVFVRELAGFVFRVDELAVYVYVEDAAGTFNEERIHADGGVDLGSQTDRYGLVASGSAVGDRNVHGFSLDC